MGTDTEKQTIALPSHISIGVSDAKMRVSLCQLRGPVKTTWRQEKLVREERTRTQQPVGERISDPPAADYTDGPQLAALPPESDRNVTVGT